MRAHQARFVTACQQLLALGVVLAALTPAAAVVSLDVVGTHPQSPSRTGAHGVQVGLSAYAQSQARPAVTDTVPVDPELREVQLTAPANADFRGRLDARLGRDRGERTLLSTPQPVVGYGAIGLTWDPAQAGASLSFEARTRNNGRWSGWTPIAYDADHGPDPSSAEARRARPGTDALLVGRVKKVQIRAVGPEMPADLQLAVIDPGQGTRAADARPGRQGPALGDPAGDAGDARSGVSQPLTAYTPMPGIYSRAQWGADDRLRKASALKYYEVHAGFVHHTVTANEYTEADVPGIIRSIYAFHTRSRGWSDIGYNFLVDKFGHIWEGRYGGVDRPVVGAHTLGYNEYSFAMSALGNYETAQPSPAMLQAYGTLFAWKLSLHGVGAASTSQAVGKKAFQAINGHRDAGSTACPGKHLYAQLPLIRQYAAASQAGWSGRERESNLAGSPHPDLIVRRASDGQGFVIPTTGSTTPIGAPIDTGWNLTGANALLNVGDWDRDGYGDFMVRLPDGGLYLYRGNGAGGFAYPVLVGTGFGSVRLLAAVGDMTGDGFPDLMGQPRGSSMRIYPGAGMAGFGPSYVAFSKVKAGTQIGIGRMNADGAPDALFKKQKRLFMLPGNGPGGLSGKTVKVRGQMRRYDWVIGVSDLDLVGHADVLLRHKKTGALYALQGTEKRFTKPVKIGDGLGAYDLAD